MINADESGEMMKQTRQAIQLTLEKDVPATRSAFIASCKTDIAAALQASADQIHIHSITARNFIVEFSAEASDTDARSAQELLNEMRNIVSQGQLSIGRGETTEPMKVSEMVEEASDDRPSGDHKEEYQQQASNAAQQSSESTICSILVLGGLTLS